MSTGIHAIKQGDVLKVFRAARLAGMEIERYEIDRQGNVVVFPRNGAASDSARREIEGGSAAIG